MSAVPDSSPNTQPALADQPFEPAPLPSALRAELESLVVGDLHGPAGGPQEQLPGRTRVTERYITGLLAPKQQLAIDPERLERAEGAGGVAAPEEVGDDGQVAAKAALFPSSIGLSFTVATDAVGLEVVASWGRYLKESASDASADRTIWQRYPMSGSASIELREGEIPPFAPVAEQPEVVVRGKVTSLPNGWLVSLFLVNEQRAKDQNKDEQWLFQVSLAVEAPNGAAIFRGRAEVLDNSTSAENGEMALLDLQYRNRVEFAVGHGTATHTEVSSDDPTTAVRIETTAIPSHEVPVTEAPGPDDPARSPAVRAALAGVVLDMARLATSSGAELVAAATPLVDAYEIWLAEQGDRLHAGEDRLGAHGEAGEIAIANARAAAARLREGIALLAPVDGTETDAAGAFRFANHTMWQQRIHSLAADRRRDGSAEDLSEALAAVDAPANRSWRPFQLAFILLNLPSLTDPTHEERSRDAGLVDLLFFPTGGGKTEAYLGLTAFTLAIRRLQGTIGERDGRGGGVAVLMRYTLRLLTAQQFERAAALICACEIRRRELVVDDDCWGTEPFRLGMWVGASVSPTRFKDAAYAIDDAHAGHGKRGASSPVQLVTCPWCGTRLDPGKDAKSDVGRWRTLLFCGDPFGECAFTAAKSPDEGLPVVTVDEELYRLLPAFVISTVDKFAQLPWRGPLHMLFGSVTKRCERHGYRSPDLDTLDAQHPEKDSHNRTGPKLGNLPAAKTIDVTPLRPPDLIIQDELHLISGPLGTMVGLYETAIDELATWSLDGTEVRPKVVASTATVRRADEQAHALFLRRLAVFPTPVLDVEDSFFARERSVQDRAGRRYVGLSAPGLRLKSAEVRVYTAILAAAQRLYERYGTAADPWMTLVGYFSTLRELAGTRRLLDDEIKNAVFRADRRGLGRRSLRASGIEELTSRVGSGEIRAVLDRLKVRFDLATAKTAYPIDVLLATNMISVGVDVPRLGVMCAVGQPKTTSEYIQATSRVGRSQEGPGLVFTLYNWARPRDLSHFETFEQYHATFYRQVEALSVTPFSPRALDRGLSAVLVALARQSSANPSWNPNAGAQDVEVRGPEFDAIVDMIASRAEAVTSDNTTGDLVRELLNDRIDHWSREQGRQGSTLGYAEEPQRGIAALLDVPSIESWDTFTCAWSLRETEPTVNLIIDTRDRSVDEAPEFVLGAGKARGARREVVGDEPGDEGDDADEGSA